MGIGNVMFFCNVLSLGIEETLENIGLLVIITAFQYHYDNETLLFV